MKKAYNPMDYRNRPAAQAYRAMTPKQSIALYLWELGWMIAVIATFLAVMRPAIEIVPATWR
jgi:hypothetical protein